MQGAFGFPEDPAGEHRRRYRGKLYEPSGGGQLIAPMPAGHTHFGVQLQ